MMQRSGKNVRGREVRRPPEIGRALRTGALALAIPLLACGGGSDGGAGPRVATDIVVTPGGPSLDSLYAKGETVQLTTSVRDATGPIAGAAVSYSTASSAIATVSTAGLIAAVNNGSTDITIASSGLSTVRRVHIRQRLHTLGVTPGTATVQVGGTQPLVATPADSRGNAIAGLGTAGYSSSNTDVASVSASGVVTGVASGSATITASLTTVDGTRTGNSVITVGATFPSTATVTLGSAEFSPPSVDIASGGSVTFVNNSGTTHNVTFATLGANNISDHSSGSTSRTFSSAGNFNYSCTIHAGMNGIVVVH